MWVTFVYKQKSYRVCIEHKKETFFRNIIGFIQDMLFWDFKHDYCLNIQEYKYKDIYKVNYIPKLKIFFYKNKTIFKNNGYDLSLKYLLEKDEETYKEILTKTAIYYLDIKDKENRVVEI